MEQKQLRDLYHSTFLTNIFKTGSEENNNASIMPLTGEFPFNLAASMRFFPGFDILDKFGENPSVDTGTPADIWEFGDTVPDYPYDTFGTAPIQYISSSSAADAGMDISIEGLDINGNLVEQIVTANGQNNVSLTTPLWRVYRMENEGDEGQDLAGILYCHTDASPTAGVPLSANVRAIINNGNNQTLMALYTIPKGKVGFLFRGEFGTSRAQTTGAVECAYLSRRLGKIFKIKKRIDISNSGNSIYKDERSFPDLIPDLTDLRLRALATSANGMGIIGTFDILLVDEEFLNPALLAAIGQQSTLP